MAIEYWRMRIPLLRLKGEEDTRGVKPMCSITGTAWHESPSNGHHKEETPLKNAVIYEAPKLVEGNGRNGNGRVPTKVSGAINIPAEVNA